MTLTTEQTDTELLRQVHAGQADAFTALYRRHQGPLYRFALLRCGSGDAAADIVQEAFMGLLTGRLGYDPLRGQLQHFLFGVARNLALKLDEARQRHPQLPEPSDDDGDLELDTASDAAGPLARLLDNEAAEEVRRALSLLPPHYRDPVILYELHDLSYQEIATVCQVDIGTVRSRLARGRQALAKRLHGLQSAPPHDAHLA
ncbi:sigma-70 family RNA polymerase sigma factor [Massilia aurea]|uniref:Sigma-70 family RNA polymerase sigma factor n=1 Tax=Massilia aurea TaxID=373040 RepID=A0A422QP32_9BURK|nr:RNA polymerase sigma factor [Massilia aurea]RNF31747.1 sigma-70 family RNA polymerase sigma factor [Massilia aurea]